MQKTAINNSVTSAKTNYHVRITSKKSLTKLALLSVKSLFSTYISKYRILNKILPTRSAKYNRFSFYNHNTTKLGMSKA